MRSLLYVPAHSERFVSKAHERGADAIILDLEDAVPLQHKTDARNNLKSSVSRAGQSGARVFVRINSGEASTADATAACHAGAYGLFVPKVRSAAELGELAAVLVKVEQDVRRADMVLVALIEHPAAVLQAAAIAEAPRLMALAVGGEDLALELGATPTPDVLRLPKLLVHYAAKATGLLSLGMLRTVADYSDTDGIKAAAQEAREHGFDGATCVHPSVVPLLNAGFAPSTDDIEWAEHVVAEAQNRHGAFSLEGRMIDAPVILRARRILDGR